MQEEKKNDESENNTSNLRVLSTWNVWGVPFGSNKIFHKTKKWRLFNDTNLLNTIQSKCGDNNIDIENNLIISCFQEVWSLHHGPFMNYFAETDENNWDLWKERMILICGIISFPFICSFKMVYDQSQLLFDNVDNDYFIPFKYVSGSKGMSLAKTKLIDSGLCILSTWKPKYHKFYPFENTSGIKHEEIFANKGVLMAYYIDQNEICGTLIFNTHLTTKSSIQYLQIQEIKILFMKLRDELINKTKYFEFYLSGDFNASCNEQQLKELEKSLKLQHISTMNMTNGPQDRCIDHIFVWKDSDNTKYIQSDLIKPWDSEQSSKCPKTVDCLSDHCWQCVVIE